MRTPIPCVDPTRSNRRPGTVKFVTITNTINSILRLCARIAGIVRWIYLVFFVVVVFFLFPLPYFHKCRSIVVLVFRIRIEHCVVQSPTLAVLDRPSCAMANNRKLIKLLLVVSIVYVCIGFTATRSPVSHQSKNTVYNTIKKHICARAAQWPQTRLWDLIGGGKKTNFWTRKLIISSNNISEIILHSWWTSFRYILIIGNHKSLLDTYFHGTVF